MNRRTHSILIWPILLVLLIGLACGGPPGNGDPGDEPVQEPTATTGVTPTELPDEAVSTLQDVQNAVIQIEAQGTFVDPEWGQYSGAGRGSGFIIDPSGIAVTNNHVVTGAALLKVWVGGDTSQTYNARVLGVSECSDLAVIDIEGEGFPFLEWYDSPIQIGLEVYTAGFPLGEPEYTLTKGIISKESASGETNWASIDSVLMHDATINPGNSGGPLIDADGKVVGVNYAAYKAADQYFAIRNEVAIPLVETLQEGQNMDSVGINGTAVVSEDGSLSGIWVSSVASGSSADQAGITGGDIITTLEGFPIATDGTMSDYCDIIRTHDDDDAIAIEVLRFSTAEYLAGQLNGPALSVMETVDVPTEEVSDDETQPFYVEEFDPDSNTVSFWSWFLTNGSEDGFDIYTEDGKLVFDITGRQVYSYFVYDPWFYEDVRVDTIAENRGMNNNNVSLICRATDEGWYEFNIANNGLWWIYAYDGSYTLLANGGSTAVNMGKGVNEYTIICSGTTLALYINGIEVRTLQENNFSYREGQIGIGVSSFDSLPIIVEFDWIAISETIQ